MRRANAVGAALFAILLVAVVFAPVPGHTRWLATIHNSAHGPVFACIALLTLLWLRSRRPVEGRAALGQYAIAFAVAIGLGVATEIAQLITGRDASWMDARHDALGALACLSFVFAFDRRVAARMPARAVAFVIALGVVGVLVAPIARAALEYRQRDGQFPAIADFTHGYDRYFILQQNATLGPVDVPARWTNGARESALRVTLLPGDYPGIELIEPVPDWTPYTTLNVDLTNPMDRDLQLVLRVHDEAHAQAPIQEFDDRFNRQFTLPAGSRQVIRIALDEVGRAPRTRSMQMDAIAGMILFAPEPTEGEFFLSRLWLE